MDRLKPFDYGYMPTPLMSMVPGLELSPAPDAIIDPTYLAQLEILRRPMMATSGFVPMGSGLLNELGAPVDGTAYNFPLVPDLFARAEEFRPKPEVSSGGGGGYVAPVYYDYGGGGGGDSFGGYGGGFDGTSSGPFGGISEGFDGSPSAPSANVGAQEGFDGSPGDGGSGSSKIVCTAMNHAYGFGGFRQAIWLRYSAEHMTKAHEAGYHAMFLPLVDAAYKHTKWYSKPLRKALENIARHRTADLRAEMRGTKRDTLGRAYRLIFEPLCYAVGKLKGY